MALVEPLSAPFTGDVPAAVKEKERLEKYFQTVLKHLPGGVAVVLYKDGAMTPEYLSEGFAAMTGMTKEQAWELYKNDAMSGVHPEDKENVNKRMTEYMESDDSQCEIVYRLKKGDESYVWIKNTLSLIEEEGGVKRIYAAYHDMTKEREEQELIRKQYNELIVQHYRSLEPGTLVVGHCNITKNRILEIIDYTDSELLKTFGYERERFFTGLAGFVTEPGKKKRFLETYLNKPSLEAFEQEDLEKKLTCFVKLPKRPKGLYAQFKMNLIATPDSDDVTGILTITDVTEQTISDFILHKLSTSSYDLVMDVDLESKYYKILVSNKSEEEADIPMDGCFEETKSLLFGHTVPRDKRNTEQMLNKEYMTERLLREGYYSFPYSVLKKGGEVQTKNLTVTAIDLRIGRICLARTDITDSLREQQGVLSVVASTFEIMGLLNISRGSLSIYTRQTLLENLTPHYVENYQSAVKGVVKYFISSEDERILEQFRLDTMTANLKEKPEGYDFVFRHKTAEEQRYKRISIIWGDKNHKTICITRADVTDMLAAERKSQMAYKEALANAEEANRAKSDFLSSMSHDIRTPMNAVIGMTTLALAHLDDHARTEDYLNKIASSSQHLLSLINDILDMSKIERSKVTLNHMEVFLPELMDQLLVMMAPQARLAKLNLDVRTGGILHPYFYGDSLRINQILINILGNAIKFTPEGGNISFVAEEILCPEKNNWSCYRFIIKDTGIGMSDEFLSKIFEPFSRNAVHVEGTGLGLSITKGLVDLMNGKISVKSKLMEGTEFTIELELEWALPAEGPENGQGKFHLFEASKNKLLAGRCFLIAEDNAINAEILCEILHMYGARTVVRADGLLALRTVEHASPGAFDAVLMDIQMPNMNGYEATRRIRNMNRQDTAALPIIAMTANAFAEDIQASEDAGMTAHVAKPIDVKLLLATLCNILKIS